MNEHGTLTILTPRGRAAISTIVVQSVNVVDHLNACFQPLHGRYLTSADVDRVRFGRWPNDGGNAEEVVVALRSVDRAEVHCHGGTAVTQMIVTTLTQRGLHVVEPETWLRNQAASTIQADALVALQHAATERCASILFDQHRGALTAKIEAIVGHLKNHDAAEATTQLRELQETSDIGLHLTTPWSIVIVGPPNVGKSSLINALVGYERAIVYDEPGTTRDIVTASTALDGWPVDFSDTAGIRESDDAIERAGVARARQQISQADLVVQVIDATDPSPLPLAIDADQRSIVVLNKCDLCDVPPSTDSDVCVRTSAINGEGIDTLITEIVSRLVPTAPAPGTPILFTNMQSAAINAAIDAIQRDTSADAIALFMPLLA